MGEVVAIILLAGLPSSCQSIVSWRHVPKSGVRVACKEAAPASGTIIEEVSLAPDQRTTHHYNVMTATKGQVAEPLKPQRGAKGGMRRAFMCQEPGRLVKARLAAARSAVEEGSPSEKPDFKHSARPQAAV